MVVKPNHIIQSDQIDYEDRREEMETEYPDKTEQYFEFYCSEGA